MLGAKPTCSTSLAGKSRKNSRDREKRKSLTGTIQNENNLAEKDKGSPSKEAGEYAGISSDSVCIYAEQFTCEHLSDDVCNVLAEDVNYKLRYIINDALLKARLLSRNAICSKDIEETFTTLNIDKVYGAPNYPNWVPFGDQNLLYLDDSKINLVDLAEEENVFGQEGDVVLKKSWLKESDTPEATQKQEALKEYFHAICQAVISNDPELRMEALRDISENSSIGPITNWFYHFSYFLLMKDITYDCLTLRALNLVEVLENSPLSSANVPMKQLKLLVRLLLQRLLISNTPRDILKPMCSVLANVCIREPLKDMVIKKINKKIGIVCGDMALPVLTLIYYLGVDAVTDIFLPNIELLMTKVTEESDPDINYITLGIYGLICKASINNSFIYNSFQATFSGSLVMFWRPKMLKIQDEKRQEIDFINMKKHLIKTRRRVDCNIKRNTSKIVIEDLFEIPSYDCNIKRKIEEHRTQIVSFRKESHVIIGKTSLLLSVLKPSKNKAVSHCCDHSLLAYNI